MTNKQLIPLIGFGILTVSAVSAVTAVHKKQLKRPNILFILTDDQERNEFNSLPEGKNKDGTLKNLTPNIDKLANEGVIFDNIYCSSPLSVPSRFTYLTGMYTSRANNQWMQDLHCIHKHSFIAQEPEITPEIPTFARQLKNLGYVTGFIGKNHSVEQHNTMNVSICSKLVYTIKMY